MRSISKPFMNYIRHGPHVNLTETHDEAQHVALSTFMILPGDHDYIRFDKVKPCEYKAEYLNTAHNSRNGSPLHTMS